MKDYKENKSNLSETFCNEVYSVVREIPAGSVTTYGDIAALLGMPQYSRMVGRALRQVPAGLNLPCHRVVNAIGRLVPGWDEQRLCWMPKVFLSVKMDVSTSGFTGGGMTVCWPIDTDSFVGVYVRVMRLPEIMR